MRHAKVDVVMIVHNHTERLTNYAERNPEDDIANKWLLDFALEPLGDNHHWHLQTKYRIYGTQHGVQYFGAEVASVNKSSDVIQAFHHIQQIIVS